MPQQGGGQCAAARVERGAPQVVLDPEAVKQKQVRNVQKKLRQITELKDKQAGGAELNEAQVAKLATEVTLLQELEAIMR